MTHLDIISNALQELGVLAAGETASSEDAAFCMNKLNRIYDNWNAESQLIYGTILFQGTLTPNHNPHTLGIAANSPDLIVTVASPPKIIGANLVLTDQTPNVHIPLKVVGDDWWMANPTPDLPTKIPYYLWPNYAWPNAQLYLWPVPDTAYDIRLDIWTLFAHMALSTIFTLPAGYEDAITLTLAESLIAPFKVTDVSPTMIQGARNARARVRSINSEAPLMSCDPAVQSVDSVPRSSIANFLSGFMR